MKDPTHMVQIYYNWWLIPNWARWIAQDPSGVWLAYSREPKLGYRFWWTGLSHSREQVIGNTCTWVDWRKQLYQIVRNA